MSLPFPKLTGLLRHFPPPSMCVAVLRGWRSYTAKQGRASPRQKQSNLSKKQILHDANGGYSVSAIFRDKSTKILQK
jgi:hypothetical protein